MKAVELKTTRRKEFRIGRVAGTAKGAGRAKAGVVNQDDQDVWRTLGRAQLRDWWELGVWILCIIGDQTRARSIRNWKNCSLNVVLLAHEEFPFF
jgi:hypothetical protein